MILITMSELPLVIIGAGGFGTELAWVAGEMNVAGAREGYQIPKWRILGFADDVEQKHGKNLGRYPILGNIKQTADQFAGETIHFCVAVGKNEIRKKLACLAAELGWNPVTLVHPSAVVAENARIGDGTYVGPGCVVCPGARVGRHVIINTHASIGHDSRVDDYAQICPGARVSGGCQVKELAFLGSNASLSPGVIIGEGSVVGANSHAVRRVSAGTTVVGCPARRLPGS